MKKVIILEAGWSRRTGGAYRSSQALREMALRHVYLPFISFISASRVCLFDFFGILWLSLAGICKFWDLWDTLAPNVGYMLRVRLPGVSVVCFCDL